MHERSIGAHGVAGSGRVVAAVGGIHGNEPGGVEGARRVLSALRESRIDLAGRFVAFAGNVAGLREKRRYLDADLNRIWTADRLARLRSGGRPEHREEAEMLALTTVLDAELAASRGPAVVLDLHSTSAGGPPFSVMEDSLRNRAVAFALPIPVILGLEEAIAGSMLDHYGERGRIAVGVEAGAHDDAATADRHESALWLVLVATGLLPASRVPAPGHAAHRERLASAARGLPAVVEILHRHGTRDGDGFAMEPGFVNFAEVRRGRLLARDASGPLRAARSGLLLLPRYQGQGDDGFFLGRRVPVAWLRLSSALRRLRAERLLPFLPGVRPDVGDARVLSADPRIARLALVPVFHLFGYRRSATREGRILFTRRT